MGTGESGRKTYLNLLAYCDNPIFIRAAWNCYEGQGFPSKCLSSNSKMILPFLYVRCYHLTSFPNLSTAITGLV